MCVGSQESTRMSFGVTESTYCVRPQAQEFTCHVGSQSPHAVFGHRHRSSHVMWGHGVHMPCSATGTVHMSCWVTGTGVNMLCGVTGTGVHVPCSVTGLLVHACRGKEGVIGFHIPVCILLDLCGLLSLKGDKRCLPWFPFYVVFVVASAQSLNTKDIMLLGNDSEHTDFMYVRVPSHSRSLAR